MYSARLSCPKCHHVINITALIEEEQEIEELDIKSNSVSKEQMLLKDLLETALAVNDKLQHHINHVEYIGSINLAERFRTILNKAWHLSCGWTK